MTKGNAEVITIVSGLPRSGTSMMMKMLDAGGIPALTDNIRAADEDNPLGYYEFEAVKQIKKDTTWLKDAAGKVVKMVHLLLLDLPNDRTYRVVFMRRKLEEVVASQNVMLERKGKSAGNLSAEQIIGAFRSQLQKVDDHMRANPTFQVLHVDYNDLLKAPAPWVEKLSEFLGGGLDKDAMLRVVDPSLYRQRR